MMVAMLAIFAALTCWVLSGSDEYAYGSFSHGRVCHVNVFHYYQWRLAWRSTHDVMKYKEGRLNDRLTHG
jgi:hypothetical protein